MNSEILVNILKIIAIAAPAIFIILLLVVLAANHFMVVMVRNRKDAEGRLAVLADEVKLMKLAASESKEELERLLAATHDGENRARALLATDDLTDEAEAELYSAIAGYEKHKSTILQILESVGDRELRHSELEAGIHISEARLQKLRDDMKEAEVNLAPVAIFINRFVEYLTNGLRVVVTEPKPSRREAAK